MKTQSCFLVLVASAALLYAVSHSASAAWYMQVNSIPGDATAAGHQGWINLTSFSYAAPTACGSVAGAGRLNIVKQPDPSSAKLMAASTLGTSLGDVTIDETGSDGATMVSYKLSDVLVPGYSVRGTGPRPDEVITLIYSKIAPKPAGCD